MPALKAVLKGERVAERLRKTVPKRPAVVLHRSFSECVYVHTDQH